jgi:comEA protein
MSKEDQRQKLYNHFGVLLIVGIMVGTGFLLIKNSDEQKEPIKITEPKKDEQASVTEVKGEQVSAKININTATISDLDKLDGIGPATAQKIIDYRIQNGLFKKVEDIMNVSGIGEGKFVNIKDDISI